MLNRLKNWLFPHIETIRQLNIQHDLSLRTNQHLQCEIGTLQKLNAKLQDELALFQERVERLENHHEDAYNVEVRQVQNIVNADFSKFEMVLMMSGILQLAKTANSVEDMEILTQLSRKIESVMVLMPQEQEFISTRRPK